MSGPALNLLYGELDLAVLEDRLARLPGTRLYKRGSGFELTVASAAIPRLIHADENHRQPSSCDYPIRIGPSWLTSADRATQACVTATLGFLPKIELWSHAAVRTGVSPDGLWWLLGHIVDAVGGWYVFHEPPKRGGYVRVEVVDREAFFGTGPVDPAYVAEYEPYLPRSALYFIDARATGFRDLDY